jgi:RES domain-containing protein
MTPISIPARLVIAEVPDTVLTPGWDGPIPIPTTKEYGKAWIAGNSSAVLRVPSAIVPREANYLLNVLHPDFIQIEFGPSEPFYFDSRLRKENPGR